MMYIYLCLWIFFKQVQPEALFKLIIKIGDHCPDNFDILDLVTGEKPLKALVSFL